MEPPMADTWMLTWARTAFVTIGRKNSPSIREHLAFDSQDLAVDFAMSLDHPQRRTVQLHLPNGDIAGLPAIERMYTAQKSETPRCVGTS
jgi:hypothetical protein